MHEDQITQVVQGYFSDWLAFKSQLTRMPASLTVTPWHVAYYSLLSLFGSQSSASPN